MNEMSTIVFDGYAATPDELGYRTADGKWMPNSAVVHLDNQVEQLRAELAAVTKERDDCRVELRDIAYALNDERLDNTMTAAQIIKELKVAHGIEIEQNKMLDLGFKKLFDELAAVTKAADEQAQTLHDTICSANRLSEQLAKSNAYADHLGMTLRDVKKERDSLREKIDALQPVAWVLINSDGECEQIDYCAESPLPDDDEFTPLFDLKGIRK